MEFEFDPAKSDGNKKKHGIDSVDAQALWDDPDLVEIPANTAGERRFLVIGKICEALVGNYYLPKQSHQNHFRAQVSSGGD